MAAIESVGARSLNAVQHFGRFGIFAVRILRASVARPLRVRRFLGDVFNAGVQSLPVICSSGAVVGAVLSVLGYSTLVRFGAEQALGALVGLAVIRELGPVLTALLVTGRAGSAFAAEIATMVTTEQTDGLEMMSIDPVDYVYSPKALALLFVMPLLSALFIVCSIAGGYGISIALLGFDGGTFQSSLEAAVQWSDMRGSIIKAVVFGALAGWISTYRGSISERTAAGVNASTTNTVVFTSVAVLVFDLIIDFFLGI
jgi:phospholipid/cholesterol/gamma-HCH transport system permease protein